MKRLTLALTLVLTPLAAQAETKAAQIKDIVEGHILPRFETLANRSYDFAQVAAKDCDPTSENLRHAYGAAFDAWILASHLRFGPTEVNDRAFALAFWPDSRGATPRALGTLLAEQDPIAASVVNYADVSIAARGFYAMEFLLYDDTVKGVPAYQCQLIQTVSADIARTAEHIHGDWQTGFVTTLENPAPDGVYHSEDEVLQEMFKSLSAGLQFTAETRLGRPLGSFDRPRPNRAEARRSGRSARHVMLSLTALQDLADRLASQDAAVSRKLDQRFERAQAQLSDLDDPIFASVATPQARLKVEVIQQSIEAIRAAVREELGPALGVAAGFNALDGD